MKFTKMHGIGNDYIYVNTFKEQIKDPSKLSQKISQRHFGVGSDGLILIAPSDKADARMIMFNADGSEAEMCGNGIRCVAKYVYDNKICTKEEIDIETKAGIKTIKVFLKNNNVDSAMVNMGKPILEAHKIPVDFNKSKIVVNEKIEVLGRLLKITCVSMGNPHCIIYVDDVDNFEVEKYGSQIEKSPFFPNKVNVEFVEVISRNEVRQRTWERGSGETLACGTGASAVCVAGVLTGNTDNKILNHLTGGDLILEWADQNASVFMTGPCTEVFKGEINIE